MKHTELNAAYFTKRDIFYYVEITDKQRQRDNLLASILDEIEYRTWIGSNVKGGEWSDVNELKYARYFKDKNAAIRFVNEFNRSKELRVCEMDADTFINTIPDKYEVQNYITIRNIKMKQGMAKSMKAWFEHRQKYKAISAYKRVPNPSSWLPCKNCGLIPLIWEYDNGRGTACGCGKNEYDHHSIQAESVMSHITRHGGSATAYNSDELRMNWNQWVQYGQDIFKQLKQNNPSIW